MGIAFVDTRLEMQSFNQCEKIVQLRSGRNRQGAVIRDISLLLNAESVADVHIRATERHAAKRVFAGFERRHGLQPEYLT